MVDTLAPKTIYKQRELDQSLTPSPVAESIMAPSKNVLSAAPKDKKVGTLLHTDQPDYTINKEEFFNRMANALKSDQSIAQEQEQTVKSSQETQDVKQTGEQVQKDVPQGLVMKPVEYAADGFNDKGMSGPILVGEQGAELVVPTGSGKLSIIDAATTAGLMTAPTHETIKGADDKDLDVTYQYTDRPSESIEQRRIYDEETGSVVGFAPPGEYGGITDVAKNVRPDLTKDKTLVPKKRPSLGPTIYNNPGNIEVGQEFAGEIGSYANGRFAEFDTPQMGIRALALDLMTKIKRHDGSIDEIINEYAKDDAKFKGKPDKNPTTEYQNFIKGYVGKDTINTTDIQEVIKAIIKFENKDKRIRDHYLADPNTIKEGIELASHQLPSNFMHEDAKKFSGKQKDEAKQLNPTLMGKPVKKAQEGMRNVDIGKPQKAGLTGFFDWLFPNYNKDPDPDPASFETAPHDAPPKEPFDPDKMIDHESMERGGYGINLGYYYDNEDEMAEYSIKQKKGQDYVPTPDELEKEKEDLDARFEAYWDMKSQEFDERDKEFWKEQYEDMLFGESEDPFKEKEELLEEYGPSILPTV